MRNDEKREDNIGEVARLQSELERLADMAADFIGTEKELRSVACIEVAIDHAKWLRSELERALSDLKINAQMLSKQTDLARQAEIEREEARRMVNLLNYRFMDAEYAKALDSRLSSGLSEDEE